MGTQQESRSSSGAPFAAASHAYGGHHSTSAEVAKMFTRVALGWFLLYQGWAKVVEEWGAGLGTFYQGTQFQSNIPDWLPTFIAMPYAYGLPWLELIFGGLLLVGIWNRLSAGVCFLVLLSIFIAWLDQGNLLPRHHLMVFTPLAAWYFLTGPGWFSVDTVLARRRSGWG